jgi:hypothetical protein
MTTQTTQPVTQGRPARDLSDAELEQQGKQAHDTRNWVFLHGTAAQFATHTARMLELEQEYLRRFPKRTWQGVEGEAPAAADDPALALLRMVADAPDGRMHKLEVHQIARAVGLDRAALAELYKGDPQLLATDKQDRTITVAGRRRLTNLK